MTVSKTAGMKLLLAGGVGVAALTIAVKLFNRPPEALRIPEKSSLSETEKSRIQKLWAFYREAQKAQQAGESERAIDLFEKVVSLDPQHENAFFALAELYSGEGKYDLALSALDRIRETDTRNARVFFQLGVLRSTPEPGAPLDLERALSDFETGFRYNPEDSGPFVRLARLHIQRGEWEDAQAAAAIAEKRNPNGFEASHLLGLLSLARGDVNSARRSFAKALTRCRGEKPIRNVLSEGDTLSTGKEFDLLDSRTIRDLFALNRLGRPPGNPDVVSDWMFLKGPFLPPAAQLFSVRKISAAGSRGTWVDVHGDSKIDLVIGGSPASVYTNKGGGEWSHPKPLSPRGGDPVRPAFAIVPGDVDGDGHADLYVVGAGWNGTAADRLLLSRNGEFEDGTQVWGIAGARATATAKLVDVNADGRADLVLGLTRPEQGSTLAVWINTGRRFSRLPSSQLPSWTAPVVGIASADLHGDGTTELFVSFWKQHGHLLTYKTGRGFVDLTESAGLQNAPTGLSSAFLDFDRDGRIDLFVSAYGKNEELLRSRFTGNAGTSPVHMALFRQVAHGRFVNANQFLPDIGADVMEAAAGDFNGDGYPDLYLACGGMEIDHFEPDLLLMNEKGGSFRARLPSPLDNALPWKSTGVAAEDIDGDGKTDLYVAKAGILAGDRWPGLVLATRRNTN